MDGAKNGQGWVFATCGSAERPLILEPVQFAGQAQASDVQVGQKVRHHHSQTPAPASCGRLNSATWLTQIRRVDVFDQTLFHRLSTRDQTQSCQWKQLGCGSKLLQTAALGAVCLVFSSTIPTCSTSFVWLKSSGNSRPKGCWMEDRGSCTAWNGLLSRVWDVVMGTPAGVTARHAGAGFYAV